MDEEKKENTATLNSICRGLLQLWQPKIGYRFNADSLWLCDFVMKCGNESSGSFSVKKNKIEKNIEIADFGSGVGIIGLLLAKKCPSFKVSLLELQDTLYELSQKNIEENRLQNQVIARKKDLKKLDLVDFKKYDLVVSCPPYYKTNQGKISKNEQEAIARQELLLSLGQLVIAANYSLKEQGQLVLVYPVERLSELISQLVKNGFFIKYMRFVHPFLEKDASRVLLMAQKQFLGPVKLMPPLIIYEQVGRYSLESKAIFGEF